MEAKQDKSNEEQSSQLRQADVMASAFIVEFPNGGEAFWLAPWSGDPGRTLVRSSAKRYGSEAMAQKALQKAISSNPHRHLNGTVVPY
jgi:hypothetical protein